MGGSAGLVLLGMLFYSVSFGMQANRKGIEEKRLPSLQETAMPAKRSKRASARRST